MVEAGDSARSVWSGPGSRRCEGESFHGSSFVAERTMLYHPGFATPIGTAPIRR